jgi:branched-chain amino acid transport system permease protein
LQHWWVAPFLDKNDRKLIRATAQDRIGAHLVGINVKWVYAFTMSLAAALAAIARQCGTHWVAFPAMGQDMLPKGFAIVVVSGLGNLGVV